MYILDKCESCHQLILKKSILMKVVRVLESPKTQEMALAKQVRDMLSESGLPVASDEDLQITNRPLTARYTPTEWT